MRVIYADVLVIINIYITYILLSLTALFTREKRSILGIIVASVLSGFYSLIILIPKVSEAFIGITKLFFSAILIFMAFKKVTKRRFLKLYFVFFGVNFAFAGLMFVLWLFVYPNGMYYNSSVVYFDIDTGTLLVLTVACYIVLSLINRFSESRMPRQLIYECNVYVSGRKIVCRSFLDTGNSLRDCFTGASVIIAEHKVFSSIIAENPLESNIPVRIIPCSTVSEKSTLYCFTPERVEIKGADKIFTTEYITVALSSKKIKQGHFDAILPCDIFEGGLIREENRICQVK